MSDHTPGPWLLTSDHGMVYALVQDGWYKGEPRMCNRFDASIHKGRFCEADEHYANASLIAAAPDLLAALRAIVEHGEPIYPSDWQRLKTNGLDAIAKARRT